MNYQFLYLQLINNAKLQNRSKKEAYFERHHVIPKSMGGSNAKDNLVLLTAKEHFVAHHLLWKIHKNPQMALALKIFVDGTKNKLMRACNSQISAKEYAKLRFLASEINSIQGKISYHNKTGFHSLSKQQMTENSKKGGLATKTSGNSNTTIASKMAISKGLHVSGGSIGGKQSVKLGNAVLASNKFVGKIINTHIEALIKSGFAPETKISYAEAKQFSIPYFHYGKICNKHVELLGKRNNSNRSCVGCIKESNMLRKRL